MESTFKSFLNVFAMIVLFVWLSNCMKVEGLRNLKEEHSLISSVVESLVKQRAYSGPSHRGGLIEGIADYVRLKAGYAVSNWARNGQGTRWDEGYSVTARFLDYCNGLRNGFVAELNKKMRTGYTNNFFVELLGKTPEQLFVDYKAKYNTA